MSQRTAATALLFASLPYGLALPQVIPLVSELAPNVTPRPLPLVPVFNASTVTVVGTIVQPSVESAVEDVTDAFEDATEIVASALQSATDAVEDVLPTNAPSILDPEASILPLILPGVLPVDTDLPPVDAPDVVPSDLPILDPGIGDGTFPGDDLPDTNDLEVIGLPPPNVTLPDDDLPDTNDLEVIDLPVPSEVPYGDDGLVAQPIPYVPDFPDEATVPISTFNAVVQPLLSVIQTLLNSLPGNFAPPLPGIFVHPLLPTETPNIFIDPLLPTQTFDDAVATATDVVDPLIDPLVDPIPTNSVATDLSFAKRQAPTDVDTNSIFELIAPILETINALVAQIPVVGPAVSDVVSDVEDAVPELPGLPVDVPAIPIAAPVPSISDVTLPDLTSGVPDEDLNVPVPDDIESIDWAAFESPPFSDLPAPSLDDIPIPDDTLNVPVPDLDESSVPIDAVSDVTAAVPAALPTSLDAFGGLDGLLDWPFSDLPETFAPDVNGELPDVEDLPIPMPNLDAPIPDDILNIPWPELDEHGIPIDLPVDPVDGLAAPPAALPTNLNWFDIPVPDDWVDLDESGLPTDLPAPALATEDFGAGFPTQALPDVPLVLPAVSDVAPAVPTDNLLPVEGPAALTEALTEVPTDALSGLPTSDVADVPALPTGAVPAVTDLLPAIPAVVPRLPFQVPGALGPLGKRQLPDLLAQTKLPFGNRPTAVAPAANPINTVAISLIKPLLSLVSSLLGKLPIIGQAVPDLGATLPNISSLVPNLPLPAVPGVPDVGGVVGGIVSTLPVPDVAGLVPSLPVPDVASILPAPGVPDVGGAVPSLTVPDVASILPAPAGLLDVPAVASIVTGAVPAGLLSSLAGKLRKRQFGALSGLLPHVGGPKSPVTGLLGGGAVKAVPGIGEVASTVTAVPKVPLAFDSGLSKTLIPADLPLDPSVLLDAIKPLLSIIESLVDSLPLSTAGLPLGKRDAAALPMDPKIVFQIISPLLQLVDSLVKQIPVPVPELPAVSNIISGLQKRGVVTDVPDLPVPLDISVILSVVKPLLDLATGLLTKLPLPAPVNGIVATLPVNTVLGGLPLGKRETAAIPGLDLLNIIKPLLAIVNQLLGDLPVPLPLQVPDLDVDSIVGGLTKRQLESITSILDPGSILGLVNPLLQTVLGLLTALPISPSTLFSTLPLSGLGKRQLDDIPLQPAQIVGLVKPLLSLVTSLLQTIAPSVSNAVSSLPIPVKRQILGIDPAAITSTVAPLQSLIDPTAALEILPPLLRVLGQLIAGLPLPGVQQLPLVNALGNLGKRQLGGALGGLTGGGAPADATQALSILPGLLNLLSGLVGSLNLPVNPVSIVAGATAPVLGLAAPALGVAAPALNVAAPVLGAATPILNTATSAIAPVVGLAGSLTGAAGGLTGALGGLTKTLPIDLPLARRAIEEFQQGPASDWESFLGELDESKQSELTGLIHDSAKAVNNDDLDAMADTLRSDLDDLSDDTKATLLKGFGATSISKRNMRYAKRQEIPGVQSIGPNLDDAPKVDLSGILSKPLDPFNQLQGVAVEGTPVDSVRPPSQGSFEQLADSSVNADSNPELAAIVAAGGLDPYQQSSGTAVGVGSPVDDSEEQDPYAGLRQPLEPAFGVGTPVEGLDATLQAAKANQFSGKKPDLPFVPQAGGSAATQQAEAEAKQQGNVLQWFQRFVKPSLNKDVDAEIVR